MGAGGSKAFHTRLWWLFTISYCTMNIPFQAMQSISMLSRGLFHQDGDTGHDGEMILNSKRHLKEYDGVVIQGFDGEIIV